MYFSEFSTSIKTRTQFLHIYSFVHILTSFKYNKPFVVTKFYYNEVRFALIALGGVQRP